MEKIVDDEKIRSTDQTTLDDLLHDLRERKPTVEEDELSSVSGNKFLKEYNLSNDFITKSLVSKLPKYRPVSNSFLSKAIKIKPFLFKELKSKFKNDYEFNKKAI